MKNLTKTISIVLFGLIGWALSEMTFYLARIHLGSYLSVLIHFVLSPLIFIILSYIYFRYINLTSALATAIFVTAILIGLDFFVVSLFIEKSFRMFTNVMVTWMPFLLIFLSVFLTGLNFNDRSLG
jgi:hypothetical protein